ncbi:MAG: hypothetical protein M3N43_07420 [Actinomycetota bacterium]|nr:hypothetical protein [Actinomycetota bacterium]
MIDVDCGLTVAMTVPGQPVMDDLSGGLLYQTDLSSIWWLASDSSQPVELVGSAENETVELQDVTIVDGITEIWFTRTSGTTIEDARQDLAHVNLGGGPQVVVDEVGGWESSSRVTVGGDVIALQSWAEGFYAFGVQHKDGGEMAQPWNPYRAIFEPTIGCDGCPTDLIVTDDGVLAAYLQPLGSYPDIVPSLVVVDVATGQTVHQIELAGLGWQFNEPGPWITEIDMLGDVALLNVGDGEGHFAALWTDLSRVEPAWSELPVLGRARLLRSDVEFEASPEKG